MIQVLVGGLFGLIFGWLWRDYQSTRSVSAKLIGEQYNRSRSEPAAAGAAPGVTESASQLQQELTGSKERARELQRTVDAQATELKSLKTQLDKLGAQQPAPAEVDSDELQRLRDELAATKSALSEAQTDRDAKTQLLQNVQSELEALRADQHDHDDNHQTTAKASGAHQEHDIDLVALKASLPKASSEPDDLKEIKGIGEKIEAMLHELEITTFKQIASLSAEQRDQVAHVLKVFPDRAERDDWQGQAKKLHQKVHGEAL